MMPVARMIARTLQGVSDALLCGETFQFVYETGMWRGEYNVPDILVECAGKAFGNRVQTYRLADPMAGINTLLFKPIEGAAE